MLGLRTAREAEDWRIGEFIGSLDEAALDGRFTYMTVSDTRTISQRLAPALDHCSIIRHIIEVRLIRF